MTRGRGTRDVERCTFCEKDRRKVLSLIAGPPGIYICNECVELCNTLLLEELKPRELARRGPSIPEFGACPSPSEIKSFLDQYVIGQNQAKTVLSVAVYQHYQRILNSNADKSEVEIEKSNVLLIGPTGSGKTLLARSLAKYLKVPFAISDATTLTEAGYVGEDVENVILRLVHAANYNIESAERGIVYIDEIDKIARTTGNVSITRDVSGEGVQQALLKIVEGTIANIPPQGGRKHPEQQYLQVNTSNILFIVGGTFTQLEQIIGRRVGKQGIGYMSSLEHNADPEEQRSHLLRQMEVADLIQFGMIPEFIGRFPVYGILDPLGVDELADILVKPKNALIRQYQKMFTFEGCELVFTDEAIKAVAKKAIERQTGVRALRSILEETLLDVFFQLRSRGPARYVITPAVIERKAKVEMESLPVRIEKNDEDLRPQREAG